MIRVKIRAGQKFQPREKIPKSESTDTLAWKRTGWRMQAHTHSCAFTSEEEMGWCSYVPICMMLLFAVSQWEMWFLVSDCLATPATLIQVSFHTVKDYVAYCLCRLVEICLHQGLVLTSEWASAKLYLLWRVFKIHLLNFLSLGGVPTLVSCSIVAVNLQVYFSLIETVLRKSNFPVFSPLMLFL